LKLDKKAHTISGESAYFSNDLVVKTDTNTDFTINSFFQDIFQSSTPVKSKFGSHSFAATVMNGSAMLKYGGCNDELSSCVISTPLTDLELTNGTFYLKVSERVVFLCVLDGSVKVHNGKKELIVQKGNALVARPNDIGILEDKNSVTIEKVRADVLEKLIADSLPLSKIKNSILFVNVEGRTIGIVIN
jgi:hypothetical protein